MNEEIWNVLPGDARVEPFGGSSFLPGWEELFETTAVAATTRQLELESNVYTDVFGAVAPRITGSISCVASAVIIYLIFVSPKRLKSIYHRVMLGMSLTDVTKAAATALTTLPMPKDSRAIDRYGFVGKRIGNVHTCNAQGFFMVFGSYTTYSYVGSLSVYYLCAIAISMPEPTIKKKVEPFLHGVPIVIGLASALPPLFLEMYNPNPGDAWCTIRRLLYWCDGDNCIRGQPGYYDPLLMFTLAAIVVDFLVIIVCLSLVFRKVLRQNNMLMEYNRNQHDAEDRGSIEYSNMLNQRHRTTKIVAMQSLAYVFGLVLTLLFTAIGLMNGLLASVDFDPEARYLRLVFEPLQGLFNFLIFVYSKIVIHRNANQDMSFCTILGQLFSYKRRETPAQVRNNVSENFTGLQFSRDDEGNVVVDSFLDDEGLTYSPSTWVSYDPRPIHANGNEYPSAAVSLQLVSVENSVAGPSVEDEGEKG